MVPSSHSLLFTYFRLIVEDLGISWPFMLVCAIKLCLTSGLAV